MTTSTIEPPPDVKERLYNSREACELAGVSYGQMDRWVRRGMPIGSGHDQGSGSRRRFSDADVRALRFIREANRVVPEWTDHYAASTRWDILNPVAVAVLNDPTILERPIVFIGLDGSISDTPVPGWAVAP